MPRPVGEPVLSPKNDRASGEDAIEFARHLATLSNGGLPLPSGLRTLGREIPAGRLRGMLESVAARVESGESLEEALTAEGPSFPAPLRGLIAAGVRSGRLAEALGRFLDLHDLGDSLRRQLRLSLIYPAILLVASFLMLFFVAMVTTHGFAHIFADFGLDLPWITVQLTIASKAVVSAGWWLLFGPIVGAAVLWLTMRLTLGRAERQRMIQAMPLVGPLARDTALAQFCPVLALLIESDVPLVEALRLAGEAMQSDAMAATANEMAREIESGKSLGEAITDRRPFPRGFGAFLSWAQEHRGLVEALRLSAETFETRARAQNEFLSRFCNVASMVIVFWWVGLTVLAFVMPLVYMMNMFAGSGRGPVDLMQAISISGLAVLAFLGLASVAVLLWPMLYQTSSIAIEGLSEDALTQGRRRFWYYGLIGWGMLGTMALAAIVVRVGNRLLSGWLPGWWLTEAWPILENLAVVISGLAILMIGFDLWMRKRNRRQMRLGARFKKAPDARVRIRLPAWRFGLRHMMFAMAPLALLMVVSREFGWSALAVLALVAPPVLLVSAYVVLTSRKLQQHESLLRVMAMAARHDQPLGPAIAAFAETCQGRFRRSAALLAYRLEQGDPLPVALDRIPGVLSKSGAIVARVGWETGTLNRTLGDALEAGAAERSARSQAGMTVGYPLALLGAIGGIGLYLLLFIGPIFASLFRDFGIPVPEPAATIYRYTGISATLPSGDFIYGAIVAGAMTFVIWISITAIYLIIRWLMSVLPLGDRLMRRRHSAVILRALAAATEVGAGLNAVLVRLARSYPRPWVRRRLVGAERRIGRGENWCESLHAEGLLSRADAAVIRSAERAGNLAWAMREVASSGERRLGYRLQLIGQVLQPLIVIAVGMLVLLFALTYFYPLITLINRAAETSS